MTFVIFLVLMQLVPGNPMLIDGVAQPAKLAFTHDQVGTDHYALSIDGDNFVTMPAVEILAIPGDLSIDLPQLSPGQHTLRVAACSTVENTQETCAISSTLTVSVGDAIPTSLP